VNQLEEQLWNLQELKREEARFKKAEELKPWIKILKTLQVQIEAGEQQLEDLRKEIAEAEQKTTQLEQQATVLAAKFSESKKILQAASGSLKHLLMMQQALLTQEEQYQEAEKLHERMSRKIEENKLKRKKLQENIKMKKKEYNESLREYKKLKEQTGLKVAEVRKKLEEVKAQLEPQVLKHVEMAEKRFPLDFVAVLKNDTCTGCRISVSSALIHNLKTGKGLFHCDNCGRLLINWFE
jgi:predicted  nucleic acid-binding Zn-ribbon protein